RQLLARLQHRRQVRLLDDRHARTRVADDVADLLGSEGLVDREWRRAKRHRGEVAQVELGPVAHHQRDGVAARDAEAGEPAGERDDTGARSASQRTLKPPSCKRPMSFDRPITNSMITSAKPTTLARSMIAKGIAFPRTFSASAQKIWPPSSGRNGNRLMIA